MSKKKKLLKIRKKWKINPKTRIKPNKKKNRKKQVLRLKKLNAFIRNSSTKAIIKYLKENEV